ncbi:MAG: cobyrinate a,c-diamide synthase [Deltaproteobacteria bacterium]|nr:cobyrinate a,c-diamide synthase [Deltaproteobacteria bacterium]
MTPPPTSTWNIPRLVIAGSGSGSGKTTLTAALAGALRAAGHTPAVFKCGPDYLDPTWHALATGRPCHNLDGWLMGREAVLSTLASGSAGADIILVEGVMGLFDGASPLGEEGSTAQIAKWIQAPVVLAADASGMSRSLAALAGGYDRFDPHLRLAGVIANRVGSRSHLDLLAQAMESPPLLGGLPKNPQRAFPSRHLGLHPAQHLSEGVAGLDYWAETASVWLDIPRLTALARQAASLEIPALPLAGPSGEVGPKVVIGMAQDEAFHFYYPYNLDLLRMAGAELVPFSPLADETLPPLDGLIFGGGYPELHAPRLADNTPLWTAVRRLAAQGAPVYGECGGLMALSQAIITLDGTAHPMAGLVPGRARMSEERQALGYVEVETLAPTPLGKAGLTFRGHQFRYSQLCDLPEQAPTRYRIQKKRGGPPQMEGWGQANVLASYVHAHWASNPRPAQGLVAACVAHRLASGRG